MYCFSYRQPFVLASIALAVVSLVALAQPARAQVGTESIEPASAPTGEARSSLQSVTVTVNRRLQALQDTPASVSAFTGTSLRASGVSSAAELARDVPNLTIGNSGNDGQQPVVAMRGVVLNDFNTNNESPIAMYADEVYISTLIATNFGLYDLARVEVLRGPQGTLYGRNATGGAVNFHSRMPQRGVDSMETQFTLGDLGLRRIETTVNRALGEEWALRIAGVRKLADGSIRNLETGQRQGNADSESIRIGLQGWIADDLKVYGKFQESRFDNRTIGYKIFGLMDPATGERCSDARVLARQCANIAGYRDTLGFDETRSHSDARAEGRFRSAQFRVEWELDDDLTLTSLTGWDDVRSTAGDNTDAAPQPVLAIVQGVRSRSLQQELRLTGKQERLDWIAGVYTYRQQLDQDNQADVNRFLRQDIQAVNPALYPAGFDPVGEALGVPAFVYRGLNAQRTRSAAVFGQASLLLAPQWTLTAGARWTDDRREVDGQAFFEEPSLAVPLLAFSTRIHEKALTWKLGGEYRPGKGELVYATLSTGFKSGGANGGFVFDPVETEPFKRERITALEVGYKGSVWDQRLSYRISAFTYGYKDIQIFAIADRGGLTRNLLTNGGDARNLGLELEIDLALSRQLTSRSALGLLDAKYRTGQYKDKRIAFAPRVSFSQALEYRQGLEAGGSIFVRGDASYVSEICFESTNSPLMRQSGYWQSGARLGWDAAKERWGVSLWVKNLTNSRFYTQKLELKQQGFIEASVGSPRSFGLDVTARF